jgi:hypothetical protein
MKVFALLIISLVHGTAFGLQGTGGQASGVRVRTKGCFPNVQGKKVVLGGG